jgi:hypothetical protein
MISEGQIVLFKFPQTDQIAGKLRPALVLSRLPGQYNDWLICMISSNVEQRIPEVDGGSLLGKLGQIDSSRRLRIKQRLSDWIQGT